MIRIWHIKQGYHRISNEDILQSNEQPNMKTGKQANKQLWHATDTDADDEHQQFKKSPLTVGLFSSLVLPMFIAALQLCYIATLIRRKLLWKSELCIMIRRRLFHLKDGWSKTVFFRIRWDRKCFWIEFFLGGYLWNGIFCIC